MKKIVYSQDNVVGLIDDSSTIKEKITPGFYQVVTKKGTFFSSMEIVFANGEKVPESFQIVDPDLLQNIITFFGDKSRLISQSIGFIHRVGVILYGKYGCGKTTFAYQVAQHLVKSTGSIVFIVSCIGEFEFVESFIKDLRRHSDYTAPVVFIMDECEAELSRYESRFKSILDSNTSLDNCVVLFTTNYIEEVPEAIKDRPSRIKYCVELKGEDDEVRIFKILDNLNKKVPEDMRLADARLRNLVSNSKDFTIDELKHAFLDAAIYK